MSSKSAALVLFPLMMLVAQSTDASDVRTFLRPGLAGVDVIQEITAPQALPEPVAADRLCEGARTDLEELWHRHYTDAIYTTTAVCGASGLIAAGTYLNPPKQVEVVPIEGVGTPDWTYPGVEFYVDASGDGSIIAGVDYNQPALTVTVHCWEAGSAVPLWSTTIPNASRGSSRTVDVSADGSTIAVLVTMQTGSPAARLYLYSPASSTPLGVFDGPAGFGRNLSLGDDGRFAAFIGLATMYVVDRDLGTMRWSGSMGASSDPVAISTDGKYLAFGWTSLRMMQWNGQSYASLWTVSGGSFALGTVAFSGDGQTCVSGWYRSDFRQNRIRPFAMPSSTPLWTYDYVQSNGVYQETPYDIAVTPAGDFFVVGSWGDIENLNPEVHLFGRDQATPLATLDTPGSMFDVDLRGTAAGLIVTAAGKTVHGNQTGRGGDLYALRYGDPAEVAETRPSAATLRLEAVPNPFCAGAGFSFALAEGQPLRVALYSADGRQVRILADEVFATGRHRLAWDGRDQEGSEVPAGLYLLRLEGSGHAAMARAVVVR